MSRPGTALLLALAFAISTPGCSTSEFEGEEIVVPSRMCGEYFFIPLDVDLDGDGVTTRWMMLFDTGALGLYVDPEAVERAGGGSVEEQERISVRGAVAGPLTFRKLRPTTLQLDHLSRALGMEIDVFLPFQAFKDHLLILDFPNREIRVARGRLPHPDGVEVFDARGKDRRPFLETEIAGKTHRLLIDSGSSRSVFLQLGRELPWASEPVPVAVTQGMEQLRYSDAGRLAVDVEIAGVRLERPIVRTGYGTELIGTQVMRRFAWTFDQSTRRVRIVPDSSDPLHLKPWRGTGAVLLPSGEGYEIARVLEGSPAERAGLRTGDEVLAIDGKRISEMGCEKWDRDDRNRTSYTVLRDGKTFDIDVEVVDLVP